jgi:hypothetical protein
VTNFEKRWAWFFSLVGWQWKYFPARHGYNVQPSFRVSIPCNHSDCGGSHLLDVFLMRSVHDANDFGATIYGLAATRRHADSPYEPPHPALFGANPSVTTWQMPHGCGGGEYDVPYWVPNWKQHWVTARAVTSAVAAQPVGDLCE